MTSIDVSYIVESKTVTHSFFGNFLSKKEKHLVTCYNKHCEMFQIGQDSKLKPVYKLRDDFETICGAVWTQRENELDSLIILTEDLKVFIFNFSLKSNSEVICDTYRIFDLVTGEFVKNLPRIRSYASDIFMSADIVRIDKKNTRNIPRIFTSHDRLTLFVHNDYILTINVETCTSSQLQMTFSDGKHHFFVTGNSCDFYLLETMNMSSICVGILEKPVASKKSPNLHIVKIDAHFNKIMLLNTQLFQYKDSIVKDIVPCFSEGKIFAISDKTVIVYQIDVITKKMMQLQVIDLPRSIYAREISSSTIFDKNCYKKFLLLSDLKNGEIILIDCESLTISVIIDNCPKGLFLEMCQHLKEMMFFISSSMGSSYLAFLNVKLKQIEIFDTIKSFGPILDACFIEKENSPLPNRMFFLSGLKFNSRLNSIYPAANTKNIREFSLKSCKKSWLINKYPNSLLICSLSSNHTLVLDVKCTVEKDFLLLYKINDRAIDAFTIQNFLIICYPTKFEVYSNLVKMREYKLKNKIGNSITKCMKFKKLILIVVDNQKLVFVDTKYFVDAIVHDFGDKEILSITKSFNSELFLLFFDDQAVYEFHCDTKQLKMIYTVPLQVALKSIACFQKENTTKFVISTVDGQRIYFEDLKNDTSNHKIQNISFEAFNLFSLNDAIFAYNKSMCAIFCCSGDWKNLDVEPNLKHVSVLESDEENQYQEFLLTYDDKICHKKVNLKTDQVDSLKLVHKQSDFIYDSKLFAINTEKMMSVVCGSEFGSDENLFPKNVLQAISLVNFKFINTFEISENCLVTSIQPMKYENILHRIYKDLFLVCLHFNKENTENKLNDFSKILILEYDESSKSLKELNSIEIPSSYAIATLSPTKFVVTMTTKIVVFEIDQNFELKMLCESSNAMVAAITCSVYKGNIITPDFFYGFISFYYDSDSNTLTHKTCSNKLSLTNKCEFISDQYALCVDFESVLTLLNKYDVPHLTNFCTEHSYTMNEIINKLFRGSFFHGEENLCGFVTASGSIGMIKIDHSHNY